MHKYEEEAPEVFYRSIRGTLEESMATARRVFSIDTVKKYAREDCYVKLPDDFEVKTEFYAYDPRVAWATYVVSVRIASGWIPVGMMNGKIPQGSMEGKVA